MTPSDRDSLDRTAKAFLDAGDGFDEAYARLARMSFAVHLGPEAARTPAGQAAALTAVNAGVRCFHGGVFVSGALDAVVLFPMFGAVTLAEAAVRLGATLGPPPAGTPVLRVGRGTPSVESDIVLAAEAVGWNGGVVPRDAYVDPHATPLAGVAAGAIAVSEVFQHLASLSAVAGRRPAGLALWRPGSDWRTGDPGPVLDVLPAALWCVGLGHLGQAYLWMLGLLPYASPGDVTLVLQDDDRAGRSTVSTSPLTLPTDVGRRKTRLVSKWMDAAGFDTYLVERRLDLNTRRQPGEPGLALFGVDNASTRALAEDVGFERVVDAGLGSGHESFLDFQLNGFPGPDLSRDVWLEEQTEDLPDHDDLPPAFRRLADERAADGGDVCGIVRMAGVAVGASFVGLASSAHVLAEAIRLAMGEPGYAVIDGSLDDPARVKGIPARRDGIWTLGYARALRAPRLAA